MDTAKKYLSNLLIFKDKFMSFMKKYAELLTIVLIPVTEIVFVLYTVMDFTSVDRKELYVQNASNTMVYAEADLSAVLSNYLVCVIFIILATLILLVINAKLKNNILPSFVSAISALNIIGLSVQLQFGQRVNLVLFFASIVICLLMYFLAKKPNLITCDVAMITYCVSIAVLLLANLLFGDGDTGSRLWINIGPFSFQPGEFVKVLLVLLLSGCIVNDKWRISTITIGMATVVFYALMKDLGNATIMAIVLVVSSFIIFDKFRIPIFALVFLSLFILILLLFGDKIPMFSHTTNRFNLFQMPATTERSQTDLLMLAISAGGLLTGLGAEDIEVLSCNVAVAYTDCAVASILAIYGVFVFAFTIFMIFKIITVANRQKYFKHPSYFIFSVCFSTLIFSTMALNLFGSLNMLPFTGVCAPFISTGYSNLMSSFALVGFVAASFNLRTKSRQRNSVLQAKIEGVVIERKGKEKANSKRTEDFTFTHTDLSEEDSHV